jgi:phosphoribosylaminoimidazole-succinocarboxamide synthase
VEKAVLKTDFHDLKFVKKGKVRDIYELNGNLLIAATDRLSAFDVVFNQGIPEKGKVLTQISKYWFKEMESVLPNHLISTEVSFDVKLKQYEDELKDRIMIVKNVKPVMVECVVRGYLTGSGLSEYQKSGSICGIKLPVGLVESSKLPEPIFTPTTKAPVGVHDENITFEEVKNSIGSEISDKIRQKSIEIYVKAAKIAEKKGIIIADTKFEFGLDGNELIIIDELLTPDSSRFWPMDSYKPGRAQPSYDKQFVRDYLVSIKWNKQPPAPDLPQDIIKRTSEKYVEALKRIRGA